MMPAYQSSDPILQKHFDGRDDVFYVIWELRRWSNSWKAVGNDFVGFRMEEMADILETGLAKISDSHHEEINRDLSRARANVGSILSALLDKADGDQGQPDEETS